MWLLLAASLCLLTPATRLGRRGGACLLTASDPSLSKEGAGAPDSARSGARGQRADRGRRRQRQRQPYLAHALKAEDRMSYKAAGLLGYRVDASGAVHVLLARQAREARSRNVQGHMAKVRVGTWNLLGGRRWKLELSALVTAAREVEEETGGALSEELTVTQSLTLTLALTLTSTPAPTLTLDLTLTLTLSLSLTLTLTLTRCAERGAHDEAVCHTGLEPLSDPGLADPRQVC